MKKIFIQTLGCKVNQFESAAFQSELEEQGCEVVGSDTKSDLIIINTCSVTGKAGAQSRNAVRRAARKNPEAKIIVTGCYAQIAAKEIKEIEELQGRDFSVIGNENKDSLVIKAFDTSSNTLTTSMTEIGAQKKIANLSARRFKGRTRAYLKVQDGCDSYCSYCIVPHTRGHSRSLPLLDVLKQARTFHEEGHKEIVITGIHVGLYGQDLDENIDIASLLESLCRETPGIRYRLSSIEPTEITNKLLHIMAKYDNFLPHLHIPLQSGNDTILLRMNRRYTTAEFKNILQLCSEKIDDIAIGIDVLAGFPGETEEQFNITSELLETLEYTYLHVFPYSKRPGTPAATYDNHIPKNIKDTRVRQLRSIGEQKKSAFYERFLGTSRPVLVEGKRDKSGLLKGFTDNYIPVSFPGDESLKNSIVDIRLERLEGTKVIGSHV